MKDNINRLLAHLLGDCIHSENATDMYNALVRLEKGTIAAYNIARTKELEHYMDEEEAK